MLGGDCARRFANRANHGIHALLATLNERGSGNTPIAMDTSVTGLTASDFVTSNGATISGFAGSGSSYSFTLNPVVNGSAAVWLPASTVQDTAGNSGADSNVLTFTVSGMAADTVAPTVLSLLGVDDRSTVMLGRDLTRPGEPLAAFRDASFADGSHYKLYAFVGNKGDTVAVDLISDDFDANLLVADASGNSLARNDDSGEKCNARLTFVPPSTGNFRIYANSSAQAELGEYKLTLTRGRARVAADTVWNLGLRLEERNDQGGWESVAEARGRMARMCGRARRQGGRDDESVRRILVQAFQVECTHRDAASERQLDRTGGEHGIALQEYAPFGVIGVVTPVTHSLPTLAGNAINILAAGMTRFLSVAIFTELPGGGATQSPGVRGSIGRFNLPFLAGGELFGWTTPNVFGWLERQRWFVLSDLGGLLGGVTGNLSWITVIAIALVPFTYWLLWRTPLGLQMRSAGESPWAAESLGVRVYTMKYIGTLISGALAGLGGAFLVIEAAGIYREGQTAGRGFIGLAAMIFGNWRPGGLALGAGLFGYSDSLQLRNGGPTVHALLLLAALLIAGLAAWRAYRRSWVAAAVGGACAVLLALWYVTTDTMPQEVVQATPYIITLVVLAVSAQRLRMPKADGVPYRKGQGK